MSHAYSSLTPSERSLRAQIAAHESWAHTEDRSARTANARKAMLDKFETQVDPEGILPPAERARRAEHARKAHFQRLALTASGVTPRRPSIPCLRLPTILPPDTTVHRPVCAPVGFGKAMRPHCAG